MGNRTELSFLTVPMFLGVKHAKVTREDEDGVSGFDMKAADFLIYFEEVPARCVRSGSDWWLNKVTRPTLVGTFVIT